MQPATWNSAAQAAVLLCRRARPRRSLCRRLPRCRGSRSPPGIAALTRKQAEAVSNLAALYAVSGELGRALAATEDALELAEALSLDEIKAESLTFRGHARIVAGDGGGIADLEEAVELAENGAALMSWC